MNTVSENFNKGKYEKDPIRNEIKIQKRND